MLAPCRLGAGVPVDTSLVGAGRRRRQRRRRGYLDGPRLICKAWLVTDPAGPQAPAAGGHGVPVTSGCGNGHKARR
jgi:hypothetical protein